MAVGLPKALDFVPSPLPMQGREFSVADRFGFSSNPIVAVNPDASSCGHGRIA